MSRSARRRAFSFFKAAISARSARICPFPGKAAAGVAVNSRIQRRNTLSATSRSPAARATATPRSVTSLTASILNSRANLRLVISTLQFIGHDLIFVSTKPAAGHRAGRWQALMCWRPRAGAGSHRAGEIQGLGGGDVKRGRLTDKKVRPPTHQGYPTDPLSRLACKLLPGSGHSESTCSPRPQQPWKVSPPRPRSAKAN